MFRVVLASVLVAGAEAFAPSSALPSLRGVRAAPSAVSRLSMRAEPKLWTPVGSSSVRSNIVVGKHNIRMMPEPPKPDSPQPKPNIPMPMVS